MEPERRGENEQPNMQEVTVGGQSRERRSWKRSSRWKILLRDTFDAGVWSRMVGTELGTGKTRSRENQLVIRFFMESKEKPSKAAAVRLPATAVYQVYL